jgi:hypothetical protein
MAPRCSKRWLRPRRMLRMRIQSSTGNPRSARALAMPLNLRQYSVTEVTLYKVAEHSIKAKNTCLMITEELVLQGEP